MENLIIEILALLILKHFIVDFLLQFEYQWRHKGTLGHPGGILHAGLHSAATLAIFLIPHQLEALPIWVMFGLSIGEGVAHYFIDWAKMNLNAHLGWKADTHPQFWWLLGLDQFLHYMTYVIILKIIVDFLVN